MAKNCTHCTVSMLDLQQVQQFPMVLLEHCPIPYFIALHLPHHQLLGAGGAVDLPVLEPGGKGSFLSLSKRAAATQDGK